MTIILYSFLLASLIMAIAFWISIKTKTNGLIDPIWTMLVGILGLAIIINSQRFEIKSALILFGLLLWSMRLGSYLFLRSRIGDDPRYEELMKRWGARANLYLFLFLQIQALCAVVLAFAIKVAIDAPSNILTNCLGSFIVIFALLGEGIADKQLKDFRKLNKNSVCDTGLWAYSRHPNYFFEFLFWFGISIFALNNFGGILALCAPIMMFYLLNFASGIPPLEQHMLKSRGVAYSIYQNKTNAFFPLPKRKQS